jgi:hypothetical protein
MTPVTTLHPLIDVSLSAERASLVAQMAADLLAKDAFADRGKSVRTLMGRYSTFEIMALLDDARQVAMQHVVAMEMADT